MTELHLPAGTAAAGPWELEVTPESAGWGYSSMRVLQLAAGQFESFATGEEEVVVMPLSGACTVTVDGETFEVTGREGVFSGPSDFVYAPREAQVEVSSAAGGRFAVPGSRCTRRLEARYRAAADVPVEIRGAGSCTRQVNNFCAAGSFEADRLIAVEVITPGGNWSSYPPHKHDEDRPGEEAELEEVYYFEIAPGPDGGAGLGYHRVYGTPERPIDVLAEVRDRDVVLVPHGYHGPSVAAPGYDMYYLNVMAGPGAERTWLMCDDPAHTWVRGTWENTPTDPRLPLGSTASSADRPVSSEDPS